MKILSRNFEVFPLVLVENHTTHVFTLPTGRLGYLEVLVTTAKPHRYRNIDFDTLIQLVVHTYHPDITERNIIRFQNMRQSNNSL